MNIHPEKDMLESHRFVPQTTMDTLYSRILSYLPTQGQIFVEAYSVTGWAPEVFPHRGILE
jgi:hypothetical protein